MRSTLVLALAFLCGCEFGSARMAAMLDNECVNDEDCVQGVCDQEICIDDSGTSVDVAIEVLRGASDTQRVTPASWAFAEESFSGSSTRDYKLPTTKPVVGLVRFDGARVPATLRFVRRMDGPVAPLMPVPVEVDTLRDDTEGDQAAIDYSTVLVAGESYDVVVVPSSDAFILPNATTTVALRSLPPLYLSVEVSQADENPTHRFDIEFPKELADPCPPDELFGCTLEAEVVSTDGEVETAEAGLQIQAIERLSGRVVSSIGETDELGRFSIRVNAEASDYRLRITSSIGRDPFPGVWVDPAIAFADEKRILIPRLDRVVFSGAVRDMEDKPIQNATVGLSSNSIFDQTALGLEGSFSASTTTNDDGSFSVELLPGVYSIIVTPPEDVENTWGLLLTEAVVGETLPPIDDLVVPSQIGLLGSITTFTGEPASGVTVLARARLGFEPSEIHRSQEAVSNELGAFAMSVDEGRYDMHVKVPPETGFAWLMEPELVMSAEQGDLQRSYQLLPPIAVHGVLRDSRDEVVPSAEIRAYVFTSGDGATRPVQVAETVSGEDGSYRLLIAPRLDDE